MLTVGCSHCDMAIANILILGGDFDDDCMPSDVNRLETFGRSVLIQDRSWSDGYVVSGKSAD